MTLCAIWCNSYAPPPPQYEQYNAYPAPQPSPVAPSGYAPVQVCPICIVASHLAHVYIANRHGTHSGKDRVSHRKDGAPYWCSGCSP